MAESFNYKKGDGDFEPDNGKTGWQTGLNYTSHPKKTASPSLAVNFGNAYLCTCYDDSLVEVSLLLLTLPFVDKKFKRNGSLC